MGTSLSWLDNPFSSAESVVLEVNMIKDIFGEEAMGCLGFIR